MVTMMTTTNSTEPDRTGNKSDCYYAEYLERVAAWFTLNTTGEPVFTTDVEGLYDMFIQYLPENERQFHKCHACRHFIERFGGLVTVLPDGRTQSAVWNEADAYAGYEIVTQALRHVVELGKITGVFLCSDKVWGTPKTGEWIHLAVVPEKSKVYKNAVLTAGQAMAQKREDYKNVQTALGEYTLPVIETAVRLLESETLYRSEKVLGQAIWLQRLHVSRNSAKRGYSNNMVWHAVAKAPAGFCHPRSSMIGTLLDDIAAGKSYDEVAASFKAKMHPLQYQRPTALPSSGAIAQAEKIVAALDASGSLARRFATLADIKAVWLQPVPKTIEPDGVFGHLKRKNVTSALPGMSLPPVTMTYEKFARTVLPTAERIELLTAGSDHYCVYVTAVNPDSTPILQWDSEEDRNTVSWYLWHDSSTSGQFNLPVGQWVDVVAVTLKPSMWGKPFPHQGEGVVFALKGAKESRHSGNAIFPEILRSEFHGVRSVIEAYSHSARIADSDGQNIVGPLLSKGNNSTVRLRVTVNGQTAQYVLDRWD